MTTNNDSFEFITEDGLNFADTSMSPVPLIPKPTLPEAKLMFLKACWRVDLSDHRPVMYKAVKWAYKIQNNAELDDEELCRLFSTSNLNDILSQHFPAMLYCELANGHRIALLPGYDVETMLNEVKQTLKYKNTVDVYDCCVTDSGCDTSTVHSRYSSISKTTPLQPSILTLMRPDFRTVKFTSREQLQTVIDELKKNRENNRKSIEKCLKNKEAAYNEAKKAEIDAIDKKYYKLQKEFKKFIHKRISDLKSIEAEEDAFFDKQKNYFLNF